MANATGTKESDFKIEFRLPPSPHRVVYYRRRIKSLSAAFFRFDTICDAANGKQQRTRRLCAAHALAEIFFLIEILLPSASDSAKNKRKRFSFSFSFSSVEHQSVDFVHTFRMLRAILITISAPPTRALLLRSLRYDSRPQMSARNGPRSQSRSRATINYRETKMRF